MSTRQGSAGSTARSARDHPALDLAARGGMFAYGVVYLIVAWLGGQLALGDRAGSASGSGALHEIAQKPMGAFALWFAAAGFAALTVWQVCQAIGGHRQDEGMKRWVTRAGSGTRAVVFAVLGVLAVTTATGDSSGGGGGGGGGKGSGGATAELMSRPFGSTLVVVVGLVIAGFGIASIHKALTDRWRKQLESGAHTGSISGPVTVLARVGYVSRGVSFLGIAALFVWAGITHDPQKSGGLDQAIVRFRDEPYGPWLLLLVVPGLACYGAFHVVRAFYLRGS